MDDLDASPQRSGNWVEFSLVAVLLGIGVAARTYQVGYNFDGDEVFSTRLASGSFAEVIAHSLQDRPHPPLHNVFLHFWVGAFGASEASARMLSVSLSAVFLSAAYALFRQMMPPRAALGSLAVVAVSPFFVYYGQQARPYALIALLATANMLAFVRVLRSPHERTRVWLWAASCAVLLFAQYMGGLLIVLEIGFAAVVLKVNRLKIALYGLGAIALIGPWMMTSMYESLASAADPLSQISWMAEPPTPADFISFYISVFGSIPWVQSRWLLSALALAGGWFLWKAHRERALDVGGSFLLVVAFGIPALVYALSVWGPKAIFADRQMIGASVAFVGVIGLFASALTKCLDVAFFFLLIAWTAVALPQAFPEARKPPWRLVANDLNERHGPEPVVVLEPWVGSPLHFYRGVGVRFWDELTEDDKGDRFLLLCRPFLDSTPKLETSRIQRKPLATWQWGWQSQPGQFNQLNLYEVVRSSQAKRR